MVLQSVVPCQLKLNQPALAAGRRRKALLLKGQRSQVQQLDTVFPIHLKDKVQSVF